MQKEYDKEQLEKLLHSLAQEAKPDQSFERMLQHKLKMHFAAKYAGSKKSGSFWHSFLKFKLQVSSALVLMLFTSTTIYAYNSDAITNGHILYPLKRSVEKVEEIFADSPEEKIEYFNRMAERRIRELDYLEERGKFDEETIVEADELLSRAEIEIANIPDENTDDETAKNEPATVIAPENKGIIIKPNLEIVPEIANSVEIDINTFSKKEIAMEEVRETRNELRVRFEANSEKNPNIGQRLENLEEKFKKLDEKLDEKSDKKSETKKEIKERRKIKDIKKKEEPFIEIGTPAITTDPIIKPADPIVEAIVNPATTADSKSDDGKSDTNPPVADQPDDKNPATSAAREDSTTETEIDNNKQEKIKIEDLKSTLQISPDIFSTPISEPKIKKRLR